MINNYVVGFQVGVTPYLVLAGSALVVGTIALVRAALQRAGRWMAATADHEAPRPQVWAAETMQERLDRLALEAAQADELAARRRARPEPEGPAA